MSFTILVVEDDASVRKFIVRVLRKSGLVIKDIYEAANGSSALDLLQSHHIDFALIDFHLPGMDGEELMKKIKSDPDHAKLPFIFISGETKPEYVNALKEKSFGFIPKPFKPEVLAPTIIDLLSEPYH